VFVQLPTSILSQSSTSLRVNDTSPNRRAQLVDANGTLLNLTGCTVTYALWTRPTLTIPVSSLKFSHAATLLFAELGFVQYAWQAGDTDTAGKYDEEWTITDSGGNIFTVPGAVNSLITILAHGG
jgi:hypothetical protein